MPVPTAIAPSALTGSPAWRVLRPAELPNTATTSTEKGENPFGLADAGVANGYIAAWTAMTGSASNASLSTATGNGLVIDDLGGLHAAGVKVQRCPDHGLALPARNAARAGQNQSRGRHIRAPKVGDGGLQRPPLAPGCIIAQRQFSPPDAGLDIARKGQQHRL